MKRNLVGAIGFASVAIFSVFCLSSCPSPLGYFPNAQDALALVETTETAPPEVVANPLFRHRQKDSGDVYADLTASTSSFTSYREIEIWCPTDGATIWYTLDGSSPNPASGNGREYSGLIFVDDAQPQVDIVAVAFKPLMLPSDFSSVSVTLDNFRVSTPQISPAAPDQPSPFWLTITTQPESAGTPAVYYTMTVDGSAPANPTSADALYDGPIWIDTIGVPVRIKAVAVLAGMADSIIAEAQYLIPHAGNTPRSLDIQAGTGGTVTPLGPTAVVDSVAQTVSATPNTGFRFDRWSVVSPTSGDVVIANPASATTDVTVANGDGTVEATFIQLVNINYSAGVGGYMTPSASEYVEPLAYYPITAVPFDTYVFDHWSGSVGITFTDPFSASSGYQALGTSESISAVFRKEIVTLTQLASYQAGPVDDTNPVSVGDIFFDPTSEYLYVGGKRMDISSDGVVRRYDVSNPYVPVSSAISDYFYTTGIVNSMHGSSSYLRIGTSADIYVVDPTVFSPGVAAVTWGYRVYDMARDEQSSDDWVIRLPDQVYGVDQTGSQGVANYANGVQQFTSIADHPSGFLAVQEDGGLIFFTTYAIEPRVQPGLTGPTASIQLFPGLGWAGKPVLNVDREYAILPVMESGASPQDRIQWYDVTSLAAPFLVGELGSAYSVTSLATDDSGLNDNYLFAAVTDTASTSRIYVIDMYDKSAPVLVAAIVVSGNLDAKRLWVNGSIIYVAADDFLNGTVKVTIKTYQIGKS